MGIDIKGAYYRVTPNTGQNATDYGYVWQYDAYTADGMCYAGGIAKTYDDAVKRGILAVKG